ncbi:MAG: hypothetical protein KA715_03680 [Xanthomonadaceae bacterium]|nr:hypothetical protein [Xanthomonadaceae bacterium]
MEFKISEVKTGQDVREFMALSLSIYQSDPHWIRPIDRDIESVFDPKRNKTYSHGRLVRWIAKDETGKTVGRIAAFVNDRTTTKGNDQPTGGIGFFETVENEKLAHGLFEQAQSWLASQGMQAMDGPINFGERDKWWGLLIEGFDQSPNYQSNYHPSYYQKFFESYGFKPYFYQLTFGRKVVGPVSDRIGEKSRSALQNPSFKFAPASGLKTDALSTLIQTVYNKAWAGREEIPEITHEAALHLVKQMKPILDPELMWFAYDGESPIGFFLCVPEVNQIFKFVNGKLDLLGKIKFLFHKYFGANHKALGLLFGVVPQYHGQGVDGALIEAFRIHHETKKKYQEIELNWVADFNGKMIKLCEQINTKVVKRHVTYRKLFNENAPFKRFREPYVFGEPTL